MMGLEIGAVKNRYNLSDIQGEKCCEYNNPMQYFFLHIVASKAF